MPDCCSPQDCRSTVCSCGMAFDMFQLRLRRGARGSIITHSSDCMNWRFACRNMIQLLSSRKVDEFPGLIAKILS